MVQIHAARDVSSIEKRPEMRSFSILCGDATTAQQWTVIVRLFLPSHFDIWIRWWLLYICSLRQRQRRRSNWARASSEYMYIKLQRRFLPSPTPHNVHGTRSASCHSILFCDHQIEILLNDRVSATFEIRARLAWLWPPPPLPGRAVHQYVERLRIDRPIIGTVVRKEFAAFYSFSRSDIHATWNSCVSMHFVRRRLLTQVAMHSKSNENNEYRIN